jgi:dsDNA-binding SOS-regulon protein
MRIAEAKRRGADFYLANNRDMLAAALKQRPDLFTAELRNIGRDV